MVYAVFLYFIFLLSIAKNRYSGISIYLISTYAFSVFFSIILWNLDSTYQYESFIGSIIFCLSLLFYFTPFFVKEIKISNTQSRLFQKKFDIIGYGISSILLLGIILLIPKIQEVIKHGFVDVRRSMYREENVLAPYSTTEHIGHSILKWLGGLSYTVLIMFFYAVSFIRKKLFLKSLLILSSLSATYLGLLVGGRTHLIYWILFFIFCYILFNKYIPRERKRIVNITSATLLTILTSYFIIISTGRAEYSLAGKTDLFVISYIGQSYLNFCNFFENLDYHTYSLYRIFPLSSNILFGRFDLREYRELIFSNSQMNIGIFYTLLGDLFVDIGVIGMLIYSFIYFIVAKKIMNRKAFNLSNLLILGIIYQIPLHGVFYYSIWKMESSACIIITVIIALFFNKKTK